MSIIDQLIAQYAAIMDPDARARAVEHHNEFRLDEPLISTCYRCGALFVDPLVTLGEEERHLCRECRKVTT